MLFKCILFRKNFQLCTFLWIYSTQLVEGGSYVPLGHVGK